MRAKTIAIWASVMLGGFLALQGGCTVAQMGLDRSFIPAKLATGRFYVRGDCDGDLIPQSGAYAYSLKPETIAAVKRQGIRFFDDIDAPGNGPDSDYFGGSWQPTPMAESPREGPTALLACVIKRGWRWPVGVLEATRRPGGYYQATGMRTLIVLPEQGYVVAVVFD